MICKGVQAIRSRCERPNDPAEKFITRLALAVTTGTIVPILIVLAYIQWKRVVRIQLPTWRNGAGLAAMFIVFALWLIQAARWAAHREFSGFLGPNWREFELFLPAFYAYLALPLALALKGVPRLQTVGASFLLAVFYGTFSYT